MKIRVGFGFDVHQLVEGRELWLGGIRLEHAKGLLGHSDADVLVHAIIDGMLGALCLSDIGTLFPDTDKQYKDAESILLLKRVYEKIQKEGYTLVPLNISLKNGLAKLNIGLAKGKKLYDKREDMKQKAEERELRKY